MYGGDRRERSRHLRLCFFCLAAYCDCVWKNAQSLLSEVSQLLTIMIIMYLKKDGGLLSFRLCVVDYLGQRQGSSLWKGLVFLADKGVVSLGTKSGMIKNVKAATSVCYVKVIVPAYSVCNSIC